MRKKVGILLAVFGLCLFLTACAGVEPEKRSYPLMMAVDYTEGGYQVIYGMPDMAVTTGQGKSEEDTGSQAVLGFTGATLKDVEQAYNDSQEKYLDLGHLQILVLGDGLVDSGKWATLLRTLRKEPAIGEDIYMFTTKDIWAVMELNGKLSSSLGEYLVGIYENHPWAQQKKGCSLREVYGEMLEQGTLPRLPSLYVREGSIRILFSEEK